MPEVYVMYKCEHCLMHTHKDEWGPGRTTCPKCGKRAPTAEAFHASKNEVWNGKEWIVEPYDPMNHE